MTRPNWSLGERVLGGVWVRRFWKKLLPRSIREYYDAALTQSVHSKERLQIKMN